MRKYSGAIQSGGLILTLLFAVFAGWQQASATLGADTASIQSDQARLKASTQVIVRRSYSIQTMQTPAGTEIRQFVSPSGTIFAVSWQGPAPDLQQLLGPYFDEYVRAASSQHSVRGRGVHIDEGDLVIDTAGHMRFVVGRAYLRSKMPQGVASDEIR